MSVNCNFAEFHILFHKNPFKMIIYFFSEYVEGVKKEVKTDSILLNGAHITLVNKNKFLFKNEKKKNYYY